MMIEKRFRKLMGFIKDNTCEKGDVDGVMDLSEIEDMLNELAEENEQLKNELRKEKSLREYPDSMYDKDLIVNIRFSMGEWKADVSVIDNE